MAKKSELGNVPDVLGQFNALKQKHPDAMLLFRKGDFYEMYREDAVKAATVLAITLTSRVFPGEKGPVKYTLFPYHALDVYLPKLIRSGQRVAICDQLETPKLKKEEQTKQKTGEKTKVKVKEEIIPNNTDMAKKKKDQAVQDKPVQTDSNEVKEKPARQKNTEQKTGTKPKAEAKADANVEQQAEAKKERKPREPQMVTADGGKVTHGHAYQGKDQKLTGSSSSRRRWMPPTSPPTRRRS